MTVLDKEILPRFRGHVPIVKPYLSFFTSHVTNYVKDNKLNYSKREMKSSQKWRWWSLYEIGIFSMSDIFNKYFPLEFKTKKIDLIFFIIEDTENDVKKN